MRTAPLLCIVFITLAARADVSATLDDYFTRAAAHGFSGSVFVARGNEILLRKGYGLADRRAHVAATPETAYNIASLDKQFIAAAILKLEESGKLRTDDKLTRFFDFVPDDKKNITLHQLLSHTSGLRNDYWDEHADLASRAAFVKFILSEPLDSPPGTEWGYSNSAFIMLERIIEIASGEPYEQYLHDALFAPAGLASSGFALPKWKPHQVAHYDFWTVDAKSLKGDVAYDDPLQRPAPNRVLLSTVDDLWKWHQKLPSILSAASLTKLYTPVKDDYAYGWNVVRTTRGTRLIHHGGSDSNTGMLVTYRNYADEGVFFVVATNSMQPGLVSDYIAADMEAMLFGGPVTLPPPAIANHDALAGKYGPYEVVAVDGGPLVLRTQDRTAMMTLRLPSAPAAQDEVANDLVRAAFNGDFATVKQALHASDGFMNTIRDGIDQWKKAYGNVTKIRTVGQRTFVFEAEPEIHSYVRVDFERGSEVLRVLHTGSGGLRLDRLNMPPGIEMVLAPDGSGRWTTWDFKLGTGAIVSRDGDRLVLQGQ
jgi:CubicO group peptidase (beta-lactamase class C family)